MWMRIKKRGARSAKLRAKKALSPRKRVRWTCGAVVGLLLALGSTGAGAEGLFLKALIDEALRNNPDLSASQAGVEAANHKVPQAGSLPDPMFMTGYQNEGYGSYTFGEALGAQWMFSVSQMVPFYGKRGLKSEMAAREAESLKHRHQTLRLKTISKVKEFYYDLFLAYKTRDLLRDRGDLLKQVEEAALSRYASGMASQQEVVMAQTEKYLLLEREEMANQKIQATEGMLNRRPMAGRCAAPWSALEPVPTPYLLS